MRSVMIQHSDMMLNDRHDLGGGGFQGRGRPMGGITLMQRERLLMSRLLLLPI